MKQEIIVRPTFLHGEAANYHTEEALGSPVSIENTGAFIEARINGDAIGNVVTEGFEVPKLYAASLKRFQDGDFIVEVDTDAKPSSQMSGYADEKALIDNSIVSEEEVDAMIACMENNRVKPSVISATLNRVAEATEDRAPMPNVIYQDENPSRKYSYLNDGLIALNQGDMTFMVGEKSTGKNVFYDTVAWLGGKPKLRIAMSASMDPDSVFGGKKTDNSAADRLSEELAEAWLKVMTSPSDSHDEETLSKAARYEVAARKSASIQIVSNKGKIVDSAKTGGTIMFDEINMAEANFLQSLVHSMADGERVLVLPDGEGEIKLHPHVVLMGGMNPVGGDYSGTRELNSATASRGGWLRFEMPDSVEKLLRANFPEDTKLGNKHFKAVSDVYKSFKEAVAQPNGISNRCLNIRGFVRALKDVERFPDATDLAWRIKVNVVDGCKEDEILVLDAMVRDRINF